MSKWAQKQAKKAEWEAMREMEGLNGEKKEVNDTRDAAMGKGEDQLFEKKAKLSKEEKKALAAEKKAARDAKKAEKDPGGAAATATTTTTKKKASTNGKKDSSSSKSNGASSSSTTKNGGGASKKAKDILLGASSSSNVPEESEADRLAREEHIIATYAMSAKSADPHSRDVQVRDVTISYHGANLIENTDVLLNYGNRYGFIGPNGSGKSTILKLIGARGIPIPSGIDVFLLTHEYPATETSAIDAVKEVDDERRRLEAEADKVNDLLGEEENSDEETQLKLSEHLNGLYERLDELDASTAEVRASTILHGLGFTKKMQAMKTREFSGGWRMRVALARALFLQPTCLVLDEPTNHLDMEAVFWLEDYLASWKKLLLFVSHSQDFMNGVCTHIVRLNEHFKTLEYYTGNFDAYVAERKIRDDDQQRKYDSEQREIAEIKDFIARFGHGTVKMVRQAQSREKQLQKKLEAGLTPKPVKDASWDFTFPDPGELPTPVLMVQNVSFQYGPEHPWLFSDVEFGIDLESRIALVGPNGAGKSTFVKLLTGELHPVAGAVRPHSHLRMAKFTQHFEDVLDLDAPALEWIHSLYPTDFDKIEKARSWLGRYGCTAKQQSMPMKQLSDGQKARIVFAKLAMDKPHLLLLDEPTNALDIESIDSLARMINDFKGGLVLVSHDMRLISQVAKDIWIVDKKTVTHYDGDIMNFKLAAKKEQQKKLAQHMNG